MQSKTFVDALARLEEQQKRGKAVKEKPSALPLRAIKTAPAVFQPRLLWGGKDVDDFHVKELARALAAQGKEEAFEPITVMRIGRHPYCIDGHHRLAAYKVAKRDLEVPVTWFEGSVRDGVEEAVRLNTRDKLPMSRQAKLEAAWRMVILGRGSKAEISKATTVPASTVANMRKKLRELDAAAATAAAADEGRFSPFNAADWVYECRLTWAEAKAFGKGWEPGGEAWEEAVVSDWAQRLAKEFGNKWGRSPRLAALAILRYSERLPPKIVEAWQSESVLDGYDWDEGA